MDPEQQDGEAQERQGAGEGEGGKPQDPEQQGRQGEGGAQQPQDPGQPRTVNAHKYERDIAKRDARIRELEEQLEGASGGKKTADERIAELEARTKAMEEERDAAKADAALAAEGCVDLELGRAALRAFDGDAKRLREAKPYLFRQPEAPKVGATGGKPAGGKPGGSDEEMAERVISKYLK